MIVSCAPFRVSFAGGGSDIESFYRRQRGAVLSCTIAKFSFVVIHPFFNSSKYHLKYAKTELVEHRDLIHHPILREALNMQSIEPGIEIVSIADIPAGTGLGSSSSFSVALINALYAYKGVFVPKDRLAAEACDLEIHRLGEPIGKQDQYAAAYGGLNLIEFERHGGVTVQPMLLPQEIISSLQSNLMLFYTGAQRDARDVLPAQVAAIEHNETVVSRIQKMVDLAYEMRDLLLAGNLDEFGRALHVGWELKRGVTDRISNADIDTLYAKALAAGALGGKLVGAGGGGFLLLYCTKDKQRELRAALKNFQNVDFAFDWAGARIAFAQ